MQIICRSETLRAVHRPSQEPISAAHSCQATAAERHGRCTHLLCDRSGGAAAFEVAQAAAGVPKVLRDLQGAEVGKCSVRQVHYGSRHLWLVHAIADVFVAKNYTPWTSVPVCCRRGCRMADEIDAAATTEGDEATTNDGITPQRPDKAREETRLAVDTDIEAQQQHETKVCWPSSWHRLALPHGFLTSKAL